MSSSFEILFLSFRFSTFLRNFAYTYYHSINMDQIFRCCKKEFNNFVCISCTNVLHPSCAARTKIYKPLKGHRIYCSQECEDSDRNSNNIGKLLIKIENKDHLLAELNQSVLDKDDTIKELQIKLQKVAINKDVHNRREVKIVQDCADEACQTEDTWLAELNEKCDTISSLNQEIADITLNNNLLKTELQNAHEDLKTLQRRMDDLKSLNQEMLSSIKSLEADNEAYSSELLQLRQKVLLTSSSNGVKNNTTDRPTCPQLTPSIPPKPKNPSFVRNNQILIVGDPNVRGLPGMIKTNLGHPVDINCQWSEHIMFDKGVELCLKLSKNFTFNDHIIFMWGSNNALKGLTIKKESVLALLDLSRKTNLLLVCPPLHTGRPVLNRIIQDHNYVISRSIKDISADAYLLPLLSTTDLGLLRHHDRLNLARHLCLLIGHRQKQLNNVNYAYPCGSNLSSAEGSDLGSDFLHTAKEH